MRTARWINLKWKHPTLEIYDTNTPSHTHTRLHFFFFLTFNNSILCKDKFISPAKEWPFSKIYIVQWVKMITLDDLSSKIYWNRITQFLVITRILLYECTAHSGNSFFSERTSHDILTYLYTDRAHQMTRPDIMHTCAW